MTRPGSGQLPAHRPGVEFAALDPVVVQRAAAWMARLWSDEVSEADRQACAAWRAADPRHELAWRRLRVLDDKYAALPADVARLSLARPGAPAGRRRLLGALGFGLAGGGLAWAVAGGENWRGLGADLRTAVGEVRDLVLVDGSRLTLATASAVDLSFSTSERLVILRAGEILVATEPDPAPVKRPFRVRGRDGLVRALGTRFSVRQDEATSRVAVFEGRVAVEAGATPEASIEIGAGEGVVYHRDGIEAPDRVADSAQAWSKGVLVAEAMRLADFVTELGRYRRGLLHCDPAIADLRVSGVFSLRDSDRALHNLTLALPVALNYRTRFWVTVEAG